jgi:hypothetical protein
MQTKEMVHNKIVVDNNIIMLKRKSHWNQSSFILKQVEEEKTTQAVKITPHINLGKGATLVPSTVKLLHRKKERKNRWGSRGLQAWPETGS